METFKKSNKKKADLRGIGLSEEGDDVWFYPASKSPLPSATANKETLAIPFCITAIKQPCHFDTGGKLLLLYIDAELPEKLHSFL